MHCVGGLSGIKYSWLVFLPSGWDLLDCVGGLSGIKLYSMFFFHQGEFDG